MKKRSSYLRTGYCRKQLFGIHTKFYHVDLEICYKGKITKVGYYAKNHFLWFISIVFPVFGELRRETSPPEHSIIISKDEKKIKKVLELIKENRFRWSIYSALFRNCFHWRNSVLKEAGIRYPVKDWFNLPKK